MQDYAQLKLFYNGASVGQLTSVGMNMAANNQPVMILSEGLSGYTDGSGECTFEWEAPIPIGGAEFNYQKDLAEKSFVDLQLFVGALAYAGRGKLQTVNVKQEQGGTATASVSWQGEFRAPE